MRVQGQTGSQAEQLDGQAADAPARPEQSKQQPLTLGGQQQGHNGQGRSDSPKLLPSRLYLRRRLLIGHAE